MEQISGIASYFLRKNKNHFKRSFLKGFKKVSMSDLIKARFLYISILAILTACSTQGQSNESLTENEETMYKIEKSDQEWKTELSDEQYRVLIQCGTEPPGTGKYYNFYEKGTYVCAACGHKLFGSDTKYSSGSGWPSFFDVLSDSTVVLLEDRTLGMIRTEVRCSNCGGHLGHVFNDGPEPTGLRYCINSVSMEFIPEKDQKSK